MENKDDCAEKVIGKHCDGSSPALIAELAKHKIETIPNLSASTILIY